MAAKKKGRKKKMGEEEETEDDPVSIGRPSPRPSKGKKLAMKGKTKAKKLKTSLETEDTLGHPLDHRP